MSSKKEREGQSNGDEVEQQDNVDVLEQVPLTGEQMDNGDNDQDDMTDQIEESNSEYLPTDEPSSSIGDNAQTESSALQRQTHRQGGDQSSSDSSIDDSVWISLCFEQSDVNREHGVKRQIEENTQSTEEPPKKKERKDVSGTTSNVEGSSEAQGLEPTARENLGVEGNEADRTTKASGDNAESSTDSD